MERSYYSNKISGFISDNNDKILGELSRNHNHALEDLQKDAWMIQIKILKESLSNINKGQIYFEFIIPRMGKRVDNIILINDIVFVVEFKVNNKKFEKYAIEQVIDYSLDLRNFHEGSHYAKLIPILISTEAPNIGNVFHIEDNPVVPIKANKKNFKYIINQCLQLSSGKRINPIKWENSIYKPTPTIIEAAQVLYRGHNVLEISRSDAGAINLSKTTDCINQIIEKSKKNHENLFVL